MIGYLARMTPVILRAIAGRDGRVVSRIHRRVRLRELDPNLHMNQAVYAEVLEYGRADWVLRSGAWQAIKDAGNHAVVAEQRIEYRRELKPLQRYVVDTRAVGLDGRLMVFEQLILVADRVHVRGTCKLIFIGADGVLDAETVEPHVRPFLTERQAIEDWRVVD